MDEQSMVNKMTREEAINKLRYSVFQAKDFIKSLEALGLIKFEEKFDVLKEAKNYLINGVGYRNEDVGMYHQLIQGLVKFIDEERTIMIFK